MSLPVLNLLTDFFYSIFGNGLILAIVIIFLFSIILAMWRVNIAVIIMVLAPLIIGLGLNLAYTNFVTIPIWLIIVIFMIMGLLFSMFFLSFLR